MPDQPESRRVFISYGEADEWKAELVAQLIAEPQTDWSAVTRGAEEFDAWFDAEQSDDTKRFDPVAFGLEVSSASFGMSAGYIYGGGKLTGLVGGGVGWWFGYRAAKRPR
jgi:hypothetical protein